MIPLTENSNPNFHLYDYLILSAMFLVSFIIGMYYAYTGRKTTTVKEYFTAGGNVGIIPAALSLLSSILDSIWYVGVPVEVYMYGIHFLIDVPILILVLVFCGYAYLPVFHELQVTSAAEYLEKRFNKSVRLIGSLLYLLNSALYVALVMYIPAMAISKVMGINIWISISSMCIVGSAYTALGGIRAVMWTDVFQALIIYTSLIAIAVKGTIDVGGIGVVWDRGVKGQRIAVAPALWVNIPCLMFVIFIIIYIGLILYASFFDCDPLLDGKISIIDELLIYFVLHSFKNIPGMAGLFIAGIFSGALSTISSCLNSMAAVTVEDLLVLIPYFKKMTDKTKTCISKWIASLYGLLTILLMILVERVESILMFWAYNNGAVIGIIVGLFSLGLFCPWVNSAGAVCGFIAGLSFGLVLAIGGQFMGVEFEPGPFSTENCNSSNSSPIELLNTTHQYSSTPMLYAKDLEHNGGIFELFKISLFCAELFTFLITLIIGMIFSILFEGNKNKALDARLFSPLVRNWVKKKWQAEKKDEIAEENKVDGGIYNISLKMKEVECLSYRHLPNIPITKPTS